MLVRNYAAWAAVLNVCLWSGTALSDEITLKSEANGKVEVSIYNQNLALIKDSREAELPKGTADVAFEGVARQMIPETALLRANGVKVLEQNYEYDLLTPNNILEESIGQEVTTVMTNPENGQNIFDKATIINSNYGNPVLKFSYGIESNFPGRLVYQKLPANLRVKPTLAVKVKDEEGGVKNLNLNYLTRGISWQANYVAEISGDDIMDWQGWVTINNQSGADYNDARVKLIAGEVNELQVPAQQLQRANFMMAKGAVMMESAADSAGVAAQNLSDYYIYNLPESTNIKDQQSKQISLMSLENVKFAQLYKMRSPLYISLGNQNSEFKKLNPDVVYKIVNDKENGLGLPLPGGTVRFYTKNEQGAVEFTGAAEMQQLAEGEDSELTAGRAFDLYANGKITKLQKLSDKMIEAAVEVKFHNAKDKAEKIEFEQNFYGSVDLINESENGSSERADSLKWQVEIPAKGEKVLTFTVRVVRS